ncbi:BLUF domain-containing protein [Azospirillum sp. TSO35-2]|uniref:BLUF domain-containing protein n=1 Tax=Azospirillum sp. TSO35-2 TaxID=716796 RepID=UPI000D6546FD|nr:BLUF domain-containing protein [Azospirillum sp. TSO35-2]
MLTIVYRSEAVARLPYTAMVDICLQSARNNRRLGVTGFLVEFEGVFLQVLEGEPAVVEELYARIAADRRHQRVELLLRETSSGQPNFGFWAMNFGPLDTPTFWQAVFGSPVRIEEFHRRSRDIDFVLDVLARAYMHACIVADIDPATRELVRGSIPCLTAA